MQKSLQLFMAYLEPDKRWIKSVLTKYNSDNNTINNNAKASVLIIVKINNNKLKKIK